MNIFQQDIIQECASASIDPLQDSDNRATYDSLTVASHRKALLKETGFQWKYGLQARCGHERVTQTVPDGMHTLADVIKNLLTVMCGIPPKARLYEKHG